MCYPNAEEPKPQARFLSYRGSVDCPVALYKVRIDGQEVVWTGQTLLDNEIPLPLTPIYQTWHNMVWVEYTRCGHDWNCGALGGSLEELAFHVSFRHPEVLELRPEKVA